MRLAPLVPPFRYGVVERDLFRGAYPSLRNMRFIRRLKLACIISLAPQSTTPAADLKEFCEAEGIRLVQFDVPKYEDHVVMCQSTVAQIVSQIIRPENLPLYLHCRDGGNNTGLVVMCLRRLQHWSLSVIFDEFCRFVKTGEISREECQFVESFRAEIEIPSSIPDWLWQGVRMVSHPTMRLRSGEATSKTGINKASTISETSPFVLDTEGVASRQDQMTSTMSAVDMTARKFGEDREEAGNFARQLSLNRVKSETDGRPFSAITRMERDRKWEHLMEAFALHRTNAASRPAPLSSDVDALLLDSKFDDKAMSASKSKEKREIAWLSLEGFKAVKYRAYES